MIPMISVRQSLSHPPTLTRRPLPCQERRAAEEAKLRKTLEIRQEFRNQLLEKQNTFGAKLTKAMSRKLDPRIGLEPDWDTQLASRPASQFQSTRGTAPVTPPMTLFAPHANHGGAVADMPCRGATRVVGVLPTVGSRRRLPQHLRAAEMGYPIRIYERTMLEVRAVRYISVLRCSSPCRGALVLTT